MTAWSVPGKTAFLLLLIFACAAAIISCGSGTTNCTPTTIVIPASATADHTLVAPGNQVQFSTQFTGVPGCSYPNLIVVGTWSTSDSLNTSISNDSSTRGLATCLNTTPNPVTVSYSGRDSGYGFTPATLTCR